MASSADPVAHIAMLIPAAALKRRGSWSCAGAPVGARRGCYLSVRAGIFLSRIVMSKTATPMLPMT
jgi:hypothetical protein